MDSILSISVDFILLVLIYILMSRVEKIENINRDKKANK